MASCRSGSAEVSTKVAGGCAKQALSCSCSCCDTGLANQSERIERLLRMTRVVYLVHENTFSG